jgi:hypothetical protein
VKCSLKRSEHIVTVPFFRPAHLSKTSSSGALPGLLKIEILERARDDIFNLIEFGVAAHGEVEARE